MQFGNEQKPLRDGSFFLILILNFQFISSTASFQSFPILKRRSDNMDKITGKLYALNRTVLYA